MWKGPVPYMGNKALWPASLSHQTSGWSILGAAPSILWRWSCLLVAVLAEPWWAAVFTT